LKQRIEEFYIENFQNGEETTLSKFKSGYDFHKDSQSYQNFTTLKDVKNQYPLLTYGCIKHQPEDENILSYLSDNFFVSTNEFFSLSFNDISENILQDLKKNKMYFQQKTEITTPVYVLIYQSPYLNVHNNQYHMREDTLIDTVNSFEMNTDGVTIGKKEIFTKMHIIYTGYVYYEDEDKILKKKDGDKIFNDFMKNKISRDKLCYINCNNTSYYNCGCMNQTITNRKGSSYESTCVNMKNEKRNYGMIYMLNKYNLLFESLLA